MEQIADLVEPMLRTARIPGAAIAIVAGGKTVCAQGFGYRDLEAKLRSTPQTVFPIASTAKAINATLLGMLVDEGRIAWDAPIQEYLPSFRLQDPLASARVTLRDLVVMRTGLGAHDFVWMENPITRADLVECMGHLPMSAGFRERFQYNNLTPTIAGHVAEVVTGQSWEHLIRDRIFEPLGMSETVFPLPSAGNVTRFYHENRRRELLLTHPFEAEPIGPAGGSIYSTVEDMARWIAFNMNGGKVAGQPLIKPGTLKEIHSPCVLMGADAAAPSAHAAYGFGWFIDTYNGRPRISHTGHLHDVHSSVMLFPEEGIGMVSFINFASSRIATLMNQYAFDRIMGFNPAQTVEEALAQYEENIGHIRRRNAAMRRVGDTAPSHPLSDYTGCYQHPGYGRIGIRLHDGALILERNALVLPLERWHYDAWAVAENELFEIHKPQELDRNSLLMFETSALGEISSFSLQFDPAVPAARFVKQ